MSKKLLIVDDSTVIRKVLEGILSTYELEVVGMAANGVEALEIFQRELPDFVTLDITMPEMDGLTVLEKIMEIKPETKVVVVTALNDKATGIKAMKLGAKSYISKPFPKEKVQSAFEKLIG